MILVEPIAWLPHCIHGNVHVLSLILYISVVHANLFSVVQFAFYLSVCGENKLNKSGVIVTFVYMFMNSNC